MMESRHSPSPATKMKSWEFNKSISYGDVLVTISLLLAGLTAYFQAEKRISQLEYRTGVLESALSGMVQDTRLELRELKGQSQLTQLEVLKLAASQQQQRK